MKNTLEVKDIMNYIDHDEYVHVRGIDEWDVRKVGIYAYEIEVNFDDYTQVTITLFIDEYNKLKNFTRLVNDLLNCNKEAK